MIGLPDAFLLWLLYFYQGVLTYFIKLFALVQITTDDLLQAAQIEERGMLDKKDRSPEMWKRLALNEAAMAIVAVNFPDLKNIEFVLSVLSAL